MGSTAETVSSNQVRSDLAQKFLASLDSNDAASREHEARENERNRKERETKEQRDREHEMQLQREATEAREREADKNRQHEIEKKKLDIEYLKEQKRAPPAANVQVPEGGAHVDVEADPPVVDPSVERPRGSGGTGTRMATVEENPATPPSSQQGKRSDAASDDTQKAANSAIAKRYDNDDTSPIGSGASPPEVRKSDVHSPMTNSTAVGKGAPGTVIEAVIEETIDFIHPGKLEGIKLMPLEKGTTECVVEEDFQIEGLDITLKSGDTIVSYGPFKLAKTNRSLWGNILLMGDKMVVRRGGDPPASVASKSGSGLSGGGDSSGTTKAENLDGSLHMKPRAADTKKSGQGDGGAGTMSVGSEVDKPEEETAAVETEIAANMQKEETITVEQEKEIAVDKPKEKATAEGAKLGEEEIIAVDEPEEEKNASVDESDGKKTAVESKEKENIDAAVPKGDEEDMTAVEQKTKVSEGKVEEPAHTKVTAAVVSKVKDEITADNPEVMATIEVAKPMTNEIIAFSHHEEKVAIERKDDVTAETVNKAKASGETEEKFETAERKIVVEPKDTGAASASVAKKEGIEEDTAKPNCETAKPGPFKATDNFGLTMDEQPLVGEDIVLLDSDSQIGSSPPNDDVEDSGTAIGDSGAPNEAFAPVPTKDVCQDKAGNASGRTFSLPMGAADASQSGLSLHGDSGVTETEDMKEDKKEEEVLEEVAAAKKSAIFAASVPDPTKDAAFGIPMAIEDSLLPAKTGPDGQAGAESLPSVSEAAMKSPRVEDGKEKAKAGATKRAPPSMSPTKAPAVKALKSNEASSPSAATGAKMKSSGVEELPSAILTKENTENSSLGKCAKKPEEGDNAGNTGTVDVADAQRGNEGEQDDGVPSAAGEAHNALRTMTQAVGRGMQNVGNTWKLKFGNGKK